MEKKKYVCKDKNNKKVYEGDIFHVVESSVFDPLDECHFYWDQGTLSFGLAKKAMNPKWASYGSTSHCGQPWCYTGKSIEKVA